jgi:hypothetical protein
MRRLLSLVGAAVLLTGNAAAQQIGPETGPPLPDLADVSDTDYQLVLLDVPAGINLISSPLDTGLVPVREAFDGVGWDWPYFFEWAPSNQEFLAPGDAPLTPSAGYWYYTPAPNTLVIFGEPYHPLSNLTMDIVPGWHLVGVPFLEGIDWQDVRLYAAGNPVGLETAMDLGWIGPSILTMVGSEWQEHLAGQPFEPGLSYWIRTTVPLSLRATGSVAATSLPDLPQGTVTVVTKFISKVATGVVDMVKLGKDVAQGKLKEGGFSGKGAVFGIANAAITRYRYNTIMDDLNVMDQKLDELLFDMGEIEGQLLSVEGAIDGLTNYIYFTSKLGPPQANAESWLDVYYDKTSEVKQSYNWGRWSTAGCDLSQSTCDNEVTDESTAIFNKQNVLHPENDPPLHVTDNFYLWWAYSVLGTQAAFVPPYTAGGDTADLIVDKIYQGITNDAGTGQNALYAYMKWLFDSSACKYDVSANDCDLYAQVYEPFEAYFQQLIADQVNLVQAIIDAFTVLASTEENQTTGTYDTAISDYLTAANGGFVHQLAHEAEVFLQVAEQIALYRAADNRFDWGTFGTTDAGQLLARADFVAAQLAAPSGSDAPWPWPPGVTGRIFYTQQHTLPPSVFHQACLEGTTTCTTLTEVAPDYAVQRDGTNAVTGDWPYLQWIVPNDVDAAVGTPTQTWQIRRLERQLLAAGSYQVARENAEYFSQDSRNAKLIVAEYGSDYSNPPTDPADAVLFGSFNALEGMGFVSYRSLTDGQDDSLHDFNWSLDADSTTMSVTYKQDNAHKQGNWYQRDYFQLQGLSDSHNKVRIRWPATISIGVAAQVLGGTNCVGSYYEGLAQSLKVLEPDNDVVQGTDNLWNLCGTSAFLKCNKSYLDRNGPMRMETESLTLKPDVRYQLRAHFNDDIYGYTGTYTWACVWGPTPGSKVTWTLFNPTFTLTKQ